MELIKRVISIRGSGNWTLIKSHPRCSTKGTNVPNTVKNFRSFLSVFQSSESYAPFYTAWKRLESGKHFSTTTVMLKDKNRGKEKKKGLVHVDLREVNQVLSADLINTEYERAVEHLKEHFVKFLSLRSSISAIENLQVKYEAQEYTLQELAQISRKPNMVVLNISVFPQTIPGILQTLTKSNLNLNPQQDGTTLYIPIPKITKEHREKLAKDAKAMYNTCCNEIREVRNKHIKTLKKKTNLPVDLSHRVENYVDTLSREFCGKAETILKAKQKELLGD